MTTLSPTAVPSTAAVAVLSTGDVRIPVYAAAATVVARRTDQPYQPPAGMVQLREAIAARANRLSGATVLSRARVDPDGVIVAPGARVAILAALKAVITAHRREVLLMAPHWPSYPWLVETAGGTPVHLARQDGVAWPGRATLDAHASDATAAVVVNSPRNPDGAVADAATLRTVLDWAADRGVVVLADEVYQGVPVGPAATSTLDLLGRIDPHCIVVDGLSKSHALAGLRIGWAIAHPRWVPAMVAVCSHLVGSTCTTAQAIAGAALADGERTRPLLREALRRNLATTLAELADLPGVRCPVPAGGIFVFPDIRDWLAGYAPDEARPDPVGWLRDRHGVQVVDGRVFGAPGHLRLSFALPPEQLADGLSRVRGALLGGRAGATAMSRLTVDTRYPADWDDDVPLLASRPWLEVMAGRIEGEPLWLTTRAGSRAEVGFAAYLVRDLQAYAFGNLATLTASPGSPFARPPVRQALTAAALQPAVLVPHLLLTWPGYASFPVGTRRDDSTAVRHALTLICRWAVGEGIAAVAIPYAVAGVLAEAARATGFDSVRLTQEATLPIPDGGFAAYLERLTGRRRRRIVAERRAWHERGQRAWRVERVTAPVLERLAQLRAAQRRRYGIAGDPAQERTRIAAVLDRLVVDVFAVGEEPSEILGFALFVRDGATWHALYFGADDGDPRSRGSYFEAVFYTPIDLGRQLGLTQISFGLGTSEAKQLRGCLMTPVDCLVTATTERARPTVAQIARVWRQPDQASDRASDQASEEEAHER